MTWITRLTLRHFKYFFEQSFDFTNFDLLAGRNNSGKSSVLQALAVWQFCVDELQRAKRRTRARGIQVVLPDFTVLPIAKFILLWKDQNCKLKKNIPIPIEIIVEWRDAQGGFHSFGVSLSYLSPQSVYIIPVGGWERFNPFNQTDDWPRLAYVPPFSGLEPTEEWRDDGPIRRQVGKAQPGSVLRNLLLRVFPQQSAENPGQDPSEGQHAPAWQELTERIEQWFAVKLQRPQYRKGVDTRITIEYRQGTRNYDIVAGGSGFQQILLLLAFFHGYKPTTILIDEPDAHLHTNLQREILDYFKHKAESTGTQFLVATHAEELARGVDASQIISFLSPTPKRITSTPEILRAMADISNVEITQLSSHPRILYVEGESDERLLRAWAVACGTQGVMDRICFKSMGGGSKKEMKNRAEAHFSALQQIVPGIVRLMLFDYDSDTAAFHPEPDNPILTEWRRKNIENYLLVPDAWKRAVLQRLQCTPEDPSVQDVLHLVDEFFAEQNLTLPPRKSWREVTANIFSVVDGKQILFENDHSLFHRLRQTPPCVILPREYVALHMLVPEIHADVHQFIDKMIDFTRK
ncbi:MAG: AAA family ATPase [Magnetococcus sp. DMHC-1]|nr:AAA family ATPase [Magnetococcales bacterium]